MPKGRGVYPHSLPMGEPHPPQWAGVPHLSQWVAGDPIFSNGWGKEVPHWNPVRTGCRYPPHRRQDDCLVLLIIGLANAPKVHKICSHHHANAPTGELNRLRHCCVLTLTATHTFFFFLLRRFLRRFFVGDVVVVLLFVVVRFFRVVFRFVVVFRFLLFFVVFLLVFLLLFFGVFDLVVVDFEVDGPGSSCEYRFTTIRHS